MGASSFPLHGTIRKTANGGARWYPQTSGVTEKLRDIYFIDDLVAYVVGDSRESDSSRRLC